MVYKIIARKYRPKKFSEVIGQEIVVKTLKNSFTLNKIGQAYLFAGPRGVGKTTLARIMGKVLNCSKLEELVPCEECLSCREIQSHSAIDYNEIDGASNRGIEQIRNIQNNLNYASPGGKYRIFVIDEAHMLTIEAFNALLKSLEEPPKKIIFILCTTEISKIPLTIQSRCQNFQFKNLSLDEISDHLEKITIKEKVDFEKEVFKIIARRCQGSVRDAENLLEQAILYCENKLTLNEVQKVLGEIPLKLKIDFFSNLYLNKLPKNKKLFNLVLRQGNQLEDFLFGILETCSHLTFIKNNVKNTNLLELNQEELNNLIELKKKFNYDEIFTIQDIIYDFILEIKNTKHTSVITNFFIIKLHRYQKLISPAELKENLLNLSQFLTPAKKNPPPSTTKEKKNETPPPAHPSFIPPQTILDQEKFKKILEEVKKVNITNYHFSASLEFKKYDEKENKIYLYDIHNTYEEKYQNQLDKLLDYINQYLEQNNVKKIKEIKITKNMLQSSIEKIKEIFPNSKEK